MTADAGPSHLVAHSLEDTPVVRHGFSFELRGDADHAAFHVVAARHRRGSIVLTANRAFTKWSAPFPSAPQAVATVDRLVDQAPILRFTGKSFRTPRDIHAAPLDQ